MRTYKGEASFYEGMLMGNSGKISIVYIGHERKLGGASLALVTMAMEMRERGHKVCVVLPFRNCPVAKALKKKGIKVYSVFFGWWMEPIYWNRKMKFCFRVLYKLEWFAVQRIGRIAKKDKCNRCWMQSCIKITDSSYMAFQGVWRP